MQHIEFNPEARKELLQALDWYAKRSLVLAENFYGEFNLAVRAIADMPEAWPPHMGDVRRFFLHRFPFAVIYRRSEKVIRITAVMHLKRRPYYWKKRR